mmetsp:Transcript_22487/g.48981  ORF Transcript_22487/g.48981 Transcript_22487/m.48981 type:complete len:589 (+) Transcript_22487:159-1925(+)
MMKPSPLLFFALHGLVLLSSWFNPSASAFAPSYKTFKYTLTSKQQHHQRHQIAVHASEDSDGDTTKQPHVVILGGGFGGINTALTLPSLPWNSHSVSSGKQETSCIQPRITLIDKSERFVFLPLLYELCVEDASLDEVAPTFKTLLESSGSGGDGGLLPGLAGLPDLSNMLSMRRDEQKNEQHDKGSDVSFIQAQVEGIDVNNQHVVIYKSTTNTIETIDYDALVIATGAEISLDAIPGATEYALPFYTVEQCLELKRRLALLDSYLDERAKMEEMQQKVNVVVVGGGYSGVELALNLVARLGGGDDDDDVKISLVHRGEQVLEYATEYNRKAGMERLVEAGVNVLTSTSVVEVTPWEEETQHSSSALTKQQCMVKLSTSGVSNDETSLLPTTILLWTAGATPTSKANAGVRNSILPRDVMGRILTSPTLNVPEYPNVFAIGDCSRPKKVPYPGTAQVAMQMATVAAWNIYATLSNDIKAGKARAGGNRETVKLLPFSFLNLGEMMTLGSNDATITTLGGRVGLSGPAASWLRRLIYAVRMPTAKQGLTAAVDGTSRKLVRGAAGSGKSRRRDDKSAARRKNKPVDWK